MKVVEEIECAVHEQNVLSNVPSFSLWLSQGANTSHMEYTTTIGSVAPRDGAQAGGIEQARAERALVSRIVYHHRL